MQEQEGIKWNNRCHGLSRQLKLESAGKRKLCGCTTMVELLQIRLYEARHLLLSSYLPVKMIACGAARC